MTSLGTIDVTVQATKSASQAGEASTARLVSHKYRKYLLVNTLLLTKSLSVSHFPLVVEYHFTHGDQTESTHKFGSKYFLRINDEYLHSPQYRTN